MHNMVSAFLFNKRRFVDQVMYQIIGNSENKWCIAATLTLSNLSPQV